MAAITAVMKLACRRSRCAMERAEGGIGAVSGMPSAWKCQFRTQGEPIRFALQGLRGIAAGDARVFRALVGVRASRYVRSEEHTSELQSRFGISYAVFCLKKNNS